MTSTSRTLQGRAFQPSQRPARCAARAQAPADRRTPDVPAAPQLLGAGAALLAPLLLDVAPAAAIGREYGVLEGTIASLTHPAIMFFLFGASVYSGYTGLQIRRTRDLAAEIKGLKAAVQVRRSPDGAAAADVDAPSPVDPQIKALEAERKELIGQKNTDKHTNWGFMLLGLGVTFSLAGAFNTFLRTGKLFPGPHLYAGAAIVVLWALAAALVPAMQKGNDNARNAHIALNAVNLGLFLWQVPTGLDIVYKVWEFASWP